MKHIIAPALLCALLTACTATPSGMSVGLGIGSRIGSHIGLGTSLNIPIGFDSSKTDSQAESAGQTVAYFDAQGNASNSAVKGGFYRQLVSKRGNEYIVQDFYGDSGSKRTDPYTLSRTQLMQFRATPENGSLTTYAYNGNLMQQQVFQNGRLVSAKY
ncbi:NemA protein [Bergeriella denitrificans]|uniref:Lipoprotein n=1 Tax=Bergeriella denitrificans TaxID=494 RepID=A0A378UHM3_BERDE|nr:NemA protein [Bergeriella denitrificans]STZ76826.1 lipoprotein [Bergeriella denitrificans]